MPKKLRISHPSVKPRSERRYQFKNAPSEKEKDLLVRRRAISILRDNLTHKQYRALFQNCRTDHREANLVESLPWTLNSYEKEAFKVATQLIRLDRYRRIANGYMMTHAALLDALKALPRSDPLRISFDGIHIDTVALLDDQQSESVTVYSFSMRGTILAIPAVTIHASDAAAALIIGPLVAAVRAARPDLTVAIVCDHKAIESLLPYVDKGVCRLCGNGLDAPPGTDFLFGGTSPHPPPTLDGCFVAAALKHTFGTLLFRLAQSVGFELEHILNGPGLRHAVKDGRPSMKGTKIVLASDQEELPATMACLRMMWCRLMDHNDVRGAVVALGDVHKTILANGGIWSKGCHAAYDMLAVGDVIGVYALDDEAMERAAQLLKRRFGAANREILRAIAEANYLLHV